MFTYLLIGYFLVGFVVSVWASVVTLIDLADLGFEFRIVEIISATIIGTVIWPMIAADRIRKLYKHYLKD